MSKQISIQKPTTEFHHYFECFFCQEKIPDTEQLVCITEGSNKCSTSTFSHESCWQNQNNP